MMTTRGTPASTASMTAALVNAGGTKTTDTSAPVCATASATVPNTGTDTVPSVPSAAGKSTDVPALRGLTPPTTFVPDASMRVVCFWPSEPVMPWTITLDASVRKIAIGLFSRLCCSRAGVRAGSGGGRGGVGELGGLVRAAVHGVGERDERVRGLGEDPPALLDVVAVEAHHERLGLVVAEDLERRDDAVRPRVARGDAAEDVHEDALDLRVRRDDVEAGSHHLGGGAAADVEEVRRLHAAVPLAGVRDDVERAHDQPGAVADDPDLAV